MGMNSKTCTSVVNKPPPRVSESRKVRKPLMEKKRRARINQSLNDLKRLLLESNSVKKEGPRPTKLEKADILELTVSHVQKLQQQQQWLDVASDALDGASRFRAGFVECVRLVREILRGGNSKVDAGIEERLGDHLERCLSSLDVASAANGSSSATDSKTCSPRSESRSSDASREELTQSWRTKSDTSRIASPECLLGVPNPMADTAQQQQQQQQQRQQEMSRNGLVSLSSLMPVRLSTGQIALVLPEQQHPDLGQISPVDLQQQQQQQQLQHQHLAVPISEERQVVRPSPSTEPHQRSFTDNCPPISYRFNASVWRPW